METYRRQIKFCYYKVAKIEINENEQSHVVGKFNLAEWLMSMKSKALVQRNVKLSDCVVNLGEYRFDSETEIYAIRAYKLRGANIPSKLKEGEDATPIPLDPDEYIGEKVSIENCTCSKGRSVTSKNWFEQEETNYLKNLTKENYWFQNYHLILYNPDLMSNIEDSIENI